MRFNIEVQKIDAGTWRVVVTRVSPLPHTPLHERTMRRSGGDERVFPQPPLVEAQALGDAEAYCKLCTTKDTADIFQLYARLVNKSFDKDDVVTFGRYLFTVLLGNEAWRKVVQEADAVGPSEPIELLLTWPASEWEMYRLPWELMRDANGFIIADRRVSLVRVVEGAKSPVAQLDIRPRVLFVIGSDINNDVVRAGAEYYGVLRRLESVGLSFSSKLLQSATSQRIEDAVKSFQPTVVHFICHGDFDKGGGYLEVAPEKPTDKEPQKLYAQALVKLLEDKQGGLPLVVVLNACYTGTPDPTQKAIPLAAELVEGGIPMVVGMGGRVADLACRLFTRRFYEALLKGESVAAATAQGRRAGIMHLGKQAEETIDWTLPTLFLAEGLSPEVNLDAAWLQQVQRRERNIGYYRTINTPPLFADRYEFIETYHQLLNETQPTMPLTVMAVEMDAWEPKVNKPQYGKTRLLQELAVHALRDGHIPCLVTFREKADVPPVNVRELGMVLLESINQARGKFGLGDSVDYEVLKLNEYLDKPSPALHDVLHPRVQKELRFLKPNKLGQVVRAALEVDLHALQRDARKKFDCPGLKVLVLLDEVHRFDDAAREFVYYMLGPGGLGSEENPVPVVFTFSSAGITAEYNMALSNLQAFLESRPLYIAHHPLGAFRPPKDEWLLYQQFLLSQDPPLIVGPQGQLSEADIYDALYEETLGVPSRLNSEGVIAAIRIARKTKLLIVAEDDDLLKKHA